MDISVAIKHLLEDKTVDGDLFDAVTVIARNMINRNSQRANAMETEPPEGLAADFLVALANEEISGVITTPGELNREFRRWLVRRDSPEMTDLWSVISTALLTLEKEGKVQRPDAWRCFNNSNKTPWYLPANNGRPADFRRNDQVAERMPELSAKQAHDRVLKPPEARQSVMAVLETLGGEVNMGEIVAIIAKNVPLLRVATSLDANIDDGCDNQDSWHDRVESQVILDDYHFIVEEERAHAVNHIWMEADAIRRGRGAKSIAGRRILCCYLLPKNMFQAKIKLETFGPTSTVQEVVSDLRDILARWLPVPSADRMDNFLCIEVSRAVLQDLIEKCSENGLCKAFYDDIGQS